MEWNKAAKLLKKKNYKESLAIYKDMNKSPVVYFNMSVIFIQKKSYEKAIKTLLKALYHDKYMSIAHFSLGNCYYRMGEYQEAISSYNEGLTTFNMKSEISYRASGLDLILYEYDIHMSKHVCYEKLKRIKEADNELAQAKKTYPGPIRVYSSKIIDVTKVFNPKSSSGLYSNHSSVSSDIHSQTSRSRKSSKSTSHSTKSTTLSREDSKTIEFIYQGRSKIMDVPKNVNHKVLVKQLSRKCEEPIEIFGMTQNDLLPIIDDQDLEALFKRSYTVIYCQ